MPASLLSALDFKAIGDFFRCAAMPGAGHHFAGEQIETRPRRSRSAQPKPDQATTAATGRLRKITVPGLPQCGLDH